MSTDQSSVPAVSDALGYLLKHVSMRFTALSDAALEPHGIDSKDLGALRVLARREPLSQLQVAQALGIDRTTMVALLDVLERRGIVTRHSDPVDRRRNLVELTPVGEEILEAGEATRLVVEAEFLAPIEERSRTQLRAALLTLVDDPPSN